MTEPLTFKRLCDAAVTMGEMSKGTADYFHGLYLNSDECRENKALKKLAKKTAHKLVRDCTLHESNPLILSLRAAAR